MGWLHINSGRLGGHSIRFVLFYSFWRLFTIKISSLLSNTISGNKMVLNCSFKKNHNEKKRKASVNPFHGITCQYRYFAEIWIFAPIQQYLIMFCFGSAELNWKVCWQSPAMFCLFTHQAKIQICCTVKLIPWNVVNLSHHYPT